jgi:hypothetical protein
MSTRRRIDPNNRPHGTRGRQAPAAEPATEQQPQHKPKADKADDKDGE